MKPHTIGRALGLGLRVAGRMAGRQIEAAMAPTQPVSGAPPHSAPLPPPQPAAQVGRNLGRGLQQGSKGFFGSLRHAGRTLWLELTGSFFLIFALIFAQTIWRTRASWALGPDHQKFLGSLAVCALFADLGVSSFWRAWRR